MKAKVLKCSYDECLEKGAEYKGYHLDIEIDSKKHGKINGVVSAMDNSKKYVVGAIIQVRYLEDGDPYNFYEIV